MKILYMVPLSLTLFLTGCGDAVSIHTGEVGRQLTSHGLEEKIYSPGTMRMDWCAPGQACPKLVRLQTSLDTADFTIESLFLPISNVDLKNVKVGIQFHVKQDPKWVNKVYEDVKPEKPESVSSGDSSRVLIITSQMIADTYLKRKAPDAIIETLRNLTVDYTMSNVPETAVLVKAKLKDILANTPVEVTEVGFPNGIGSPPENVLISKRELYAIEEQKTRRIKALEADIVIEEQRQAFQRLRAKNDIEIANSLGVSVFDYMTQKSLEKFSDAALEGTPVAIGGNMFIQKSEKRIN